MLVTNIDAPSGGVQKNSRLLIKKLNERGIKTFVCARNYNNLPRSEIKDGTLFRRSPVFGNSMAINSIIYLIDGFFWLIRNRKKYDVIHCQQMYGPTMVAAIVSFIIKKPILTRITGSGELGEVRMIRQMTFANLRLRLLRRVQKWVVLTGEMKREIGTLNISDDKIEVIYNSTEIPSESASDEETRKIYRKKINLEYEKIVVFTGRLSQEKGLDILMNAWKIVSVKYPQAHLLLLGEGGSFRNIEIEIRELVKKFNLMETVHFLGHVHNVKEYLLASDVFVLPSRSEGMSNALVEAMAAGMTIVATDIPANREICTNEVNSLLVKTNEPRLLANAIIKTFDSPEIAVRLANQAKLFAEENLSLESMAAQYINLYQKMLNDN